MVADIYQIAAFESLRVGAYDGTAPLSTLTRRADFGVGTFNGLNGELILLEGRLYRVSAFGDAVMASPKSLSPFAFAARFRADRTYRIDTRLSSAGLQAMIDRDFPGGMLAIRVSGRFKGMLGRSFPPQSRPYRPFGAILDQQTQLPFGAIKGDFVGFRMPKTVAIGNLNVPGYHFHFIAADRRRGGHVLKYELESGTVQVMRVGRIIRISR